ncbi:MAG TPA: tetratricopeptide repeat protein [Bryobacteraceae bacterium]|jgi:tetratricopeptide (TPR) repeat protein|nr:tetratricopeptide repeat protein [Bryobacteraceae bacterium]
MKYRNVAMPALGILLFALAGFAQTSSLEGDVKGEDGAPLKGALIKIDREDIKGHYQVKTDKKGHYYYGGLPLGQYKVTLEVDGKEVDFVDKVRTRLGDPVDNNFDLHAAAQKRQALNQAADTGNLSKEQSRGMSAEEKAAFEKANKERTEMKAKGKALNDAFNGGKEAMNAKQFDVAVTQFSKAGEMAPDQPVIWANLGDAEIALSKTKTGAEHDDALNKGLDAYKKTLELKPDDAGVHNNYALALAQAKKFEEAQAELAKAAQLDPPSAGKYYYNLGALLVNNGQTEPAGQAFKKAIDADPKYADAQYQYGIYLIGKATLGGDGKYEPVPGTREAFQAYLDLKPDGPNAESAKGMLASLSGAVDTSYQNPAAAKNKKKTTSKN